MSFRVFFCFAFFVPSSFTIAQDQVIAIDAGRQEFDTQMTFSFDKEKSGWAVWKSYLLGKDKVLARRVNLKGRLGPVIELSPNPGVLDGVDVSLSEKGELRVCWAEAIQTTPKVEWRIVSRKLSDSPSPVNIVGKGIWPKSDSGGLVWQKPGKFGDTILMWQRGDEPIEIVSESGNRPVIQKSGNNTWAFWDSYDRETGDQTLLGRTLHPVKSPVVAISKPSSGRNMIPLAITNDSEGLCVAWLKLSDVIGGDGVIDMIHTAHASRLTKAGKWEPITDDAGNSEGCVMLSGLLPDLRPKKGYPSGYTGNRRKPMLLDDGKNGVWLLWERKENPSLGKQTGQLLGRRFQNGKWQGQPVLFYKGLTHYNLAKPMKTRMDENGKRHFYIVGSDLPHDFVHPSYLVRIDLENAESIELDNWRDQFKPVKLPLESVERYSTIIDGKKLKLFWGDLHCHSGLTGDAEGEPDEILAYGRDRAKLDVMVLQDNDDVHGRILTEGEYYMGVAHSQAFTEPGKFVALPGYEWTQRKSKTGVPKPFASGFQQKIPGGFPNHRTVIYGAEGGPIVRYFEVGQNFDLFAKTVAAAGGILNSQHPAWEQSDHPNEANLEVTACWGIYIRSVPERFHAELDRGRRRGFVGTSDSHRRNPGLCGGLTGIYASELTPKAIHEALAKHRCFATNGSKIVVDSRANGLLSDKEIEVKNGSVKLSLFVKGTTPITSVKLVTNGGKTQIIYSGDEKKSDFRIEKTLTGLSKGEHWFYWAIEQEGNSTQYSGNISVAQGNAAWSSPHFVVVK